MKNHKKIQLLFVFTLLTVTTTIAQDLKIFNQNSSRSNNAKAAINNDSWSFGLNSGASFGVGSNENSLFRGNSMATKMSGRYYLGNIGLGFSSGIVPGSISDNSLNKFIVDRKIQRDQVQLSTGKPFNSYLMLGPSVRFGSRVIVSAEMQGGIFFNNPGSVTIGQLGATRPLYRFDASGKNLFPGFSGNINIGYPLGSATHFFITTDYLQTRSSIRLLDPQRGIDVPIEQNRNVKLFTTGIGITKSFGSNNKRVLPTVNKREIAIDESGVHIVQRDQSTGLATGKRLLPTVNKREIAIDEPGVQIAIIRDQSSGQSTGKRLLPTVNKREIVSPRDISSGQSTGRTYRPGRPTYGNRTTESCGPVTIKTTLPDGTVEEKTFACTDDAAEYSRQTPKRDFGDRMNNADQQQSYFKRTFAAPHILEQKGIISGRVTRTSLTNAGVVTNSSMIRNGVATGAGAAAGAASISNEGMTTNIYAREASTGLATGKRAKESSSGLATGRRQYEPVFFEGQSEVCNPCMAIVTNNTTRGGSVNMNSQSSSTRQTNQSSFGTMVRSSTDENCDGVAGLNVSLIDINSGNAIATTKTESCGDFWFANVPYGAYVVRINGSISRKKGYDVYLKNEGKYDVAGEMLAAGDQWKIFINSEGDNSSGNKMAINTSHSNIKNLIILEADTDGDGEFESLRVNANFTDGSSQDVTPQAIVNTSRSNIKQITVSPGSSTTNNTQKASINTTRSNIKHIAISVGDLDGDGISQVTASGVFTDGKSKDITNNLKINTSHSNIRQYVVSLDGLSETADGNSESRITKSRSNIQNNRTINEEEDSNNGSLNTGAKITKSRSNIQNNRMMNEEEDSDNGSLNTGAKITKSRSNIQNNRMMNDEDEEGIWSPRSNIKLLRVTTGDVDGDGFEEMLIGGAIPGGSVISAARMPGEPIPGIDVKLGKNPGGQMLSAVQTNQYGEFEFTGLEKGDYYITTEQNIIIDDETIIIVGDDYAEENINTSEDNLGSSNTARKGWDGTIKGNSKNINTSEANIGKDEIAIDESGESRPKTKPVKSIGPVKWMAPEAMKTAINTSNDNLINMLSSLDALEQQLNADQSNAKSLVNTSRSNIKNQRAAINDLQQTLDGLQTKDKDAAMKELQQKRNEADLQFLKLYNSLQQMGAPYNSISNVLKTKHDTVKNSIGNIR